MPTTRAPKTLLLLAALVLLLVGAEAVASYRTLPPASPPNPRPMLEGAQVDPAILAILDRSCRDCHSDLTRYPWYSYLAPVSGWVGEDVKRGRGYLNLSEWTAYSKVRKMRALTGIANQVKDGAMPLDIYLRMHPEARLSEAEQTAVFDWAQRERLRLITESP